jgi:hypothetical protein
LAVATIAASNLEIRMRPPSLVCVVVLGTVCPRAAQTLDGPPAARQIEHISVCHGEKVSDPFFKATVGSSPRNCVKELGSERRAGP